MSRRKDRERFLAKKRLNPDYVGFRGSGSAAAPSEPPLEKVTCSRCGRARNVPAGVALERAEDYVCATCREEEEVEDSALDAGPAEAPAPEAVENPKATE